VWRSLVSGIHPDNPHNFLTYEMLGGNYTLQNDSTQFALGNCFEADMPGR
jgi:hypothetical protein